MTSEYLRVAAAVPQVAPANVAANQEAVAAILARATAEGARVVVLPELCLTGYTCADLFYQPSLLDAAESALAELLPQCGDGLVAIGLPVRVSGRIYNCAAIVAAGRLRQMTPFEDGTPRSFGSIAFAWRSARAKLLKNPSQT